jgi:hypothetical protein
LRRPFTSAPNGSLARDCRLTAAGARLRIRWPLLIDRAPTPSPARASGHASLPAPRGTKVASGRARFSCARPRAVFCRACSRCACFTHASGGLDIRGLARFKLISPACPTCRCSLTAAPRRDLHPPTSRPWSVPRARSSLPDSFGFLVRPQLNGATLGRRRKPRGLEIVLVAGGVDRDCHLIAQTIHVGADRIARS